MIRIALIVLLLISTDIHLKAQTDIGNYLYNNYQRQGSQQLFQKVEALKRGKRSNIIALISALPESSRNEIKRNADLALDGSWPVLSFSLFNEFKVTGNRVNYENAYFARRRKLSTLVLGELIAADGKYLPEIVNGIGLIAEESTWALPAHMNMQKAGLGLPDAQEPIIDLFVAQTGMLLSYVEFLLGDQLNAYSPLVNTRINAELNKRVFDPYLQRNDFWWMGFETKRKMNNWNIFINTNVLSASLLAQKNSAAQKLLIDKSIRSVDNFLKTYPLDGGCDEGPSYWGMAGGALIEYIDLLSFFSDGKLDFSSNQLVHRIGTYLYKVHIDGNYYVNFADAAALAGQDASKIYGFGKLFKDQQLLNFAAYVRKINNGETNFDLGNIQGFVGSLEVGEGFKTLKPKAPQPKNEWLSDIQVLTARQYEGSAKGMFFAAKGGHNGESHNHNDIGNFILYKDGSPIIVDAGVGVYTKQTFSADRYKLWYMQSSWHNCPTINGAIQQVGAEFKATKTRYQKDGEVIELSMDLSAAYPAEADVVFWNRNFAFNQAKGTVTLSESYKLNSFREPSAINLLVNAKVVLVGEGLLKLTNPQGKTLSIGFDPKLFEYQCETRKIDDARLAGSWHNDLNRVVLKKKGNQLQGKHSIVFKD